MDFGFSEEQVLLRDSVRKLMARHATPEYVRRLDRESAYPDALYAEWVKAGLLSMPFPEEYGGLGGNAIDMAIVAEELSRTSADFCMAYGGSVFCGLNIAHKASEEQKRTWLPKLLSGEVKFTISMSEPDAGSDIGAMRTTAVRDGDYYVLNGQKLWATGAAAKNNVINMYVKTDTKTHYRKGMSLFLIDNDTPGVKFNKLDMLGRRATGTYEVFFTDVRVDESRVIGGENKGWDCLLSGLQVERIVSAAGNCGAAQACVDLASAYAKERKQFGRTIGSNQAIAHMLADMQTETAAAWALTWQAANVIASGQDAFKEITMAKLKASETYVNVARMGMQICGGMGYSKEFDMERHYRDASPSTVAAGTSQIQRNLIAGMMGHKVS
jgi:alkylation response protein AidB-like acyl-CoA dehydrogenase